MKEKDSSGSGGADPGLARGVANVIDAALDVGVSLARTFAQASAGGQRVSEPAAGTSPLGAIVHYGLATFGNVASAVTSAVGAGRGAAAGTAPGSANAASGARAKGPSVMQGATLRVPLSVENPGESVMRGLAPRLRGVRRDGRDATATFAPEAIRFSPALFDVAPRDFEKLTVFVDVPGDAPEGEYRLVLALGASEPDLPIVFRVVAAAANPAL